MEEEIEVQLSAHPYIVMVLQRVIVGMVGMEQVMFEPGSDGVGDVEKVPERGAAVRVRFVVGLGMMPVPVVNGRPVYAPDEMLNVGIGKPEDGAVPLGVGLSVPERGASVKGGTCVDPVPVGPSGDVMLMMGP